MWFREMYYYLRGWAQCNDCDAPVRRVGSNPLMWRHVNIAKARSNCSYASYNAPQPKGGDPLVTGSGESHDH